MQKQKKKPIPEVKKPILQGSWHGRDAFKLGRRVALSTLVVTVVYLAIGVMLNFDNLALRVILGLALVGAAGAYLYMSGLSVGEGDAAFAEIMYARQQEGKQVTRADRERCFHPAKGLFAVLLGCSIYMIVALIYAVIAKPSEYTLGVLPSWMSSLTRQTEYGDALAYYSVRTGLSASDILRIACRAMVMPFISIALLISDSAVLLVERLSPLLVTLAPLGFALGYSKGLKARVRINTGIVIGDNRKRRKERKERARRAQKSPQRLI